VNPLTLLLVVERLLLLGLRLLVRVVVVVVAGLFLLLGALFLFERFRFRLVLLLGGRGHRALALRARLLGPGLRLFGVPAVRALDGDRHGHNS
jgi:hypothetical protein